MDREARLKRLRFRAWHRGTREADYTMGGFYDRYHETWRDDDISWFEDLLEQDDVDVLAWAMNQQPVPQRFAGKQMEALQKLDFVEIPR